MQLNCTCKCVERSVRRTPAANYIKEIDMKIKTKIRANGQVRSCS
jgi:hypothetical protein